jgi:putative oxidoreductase
MDVGRFLLRASIGGFFIGHGTQKLFGWFGGHGLAATGQFFEAVGLRPGRRQALTAGIAEAGGGILLAAGLATPAAAAALTAVMLTAIRTIHFPKGPWVSEGGYEYNVVLIASMLALTDLGPGEWSLDAALGLERRGAKWMLGALAAGAAGSAIATAKRTPQPDPLESNSTRGTSVPTADAPNAAARPQTTGES